jgi:hypothetical protein
MALLRVALSEANDDAGARLSAPGPPRRLPSLVDDCLVETNGTGLLGGKPNKLYCPSPTS